jgi:Tfp pilus assembly protein PilX
MKYVPRHRRSAKGQTLIMALFVMGILLVLGFVFIGVINQNIRRAGVAQQRSASNDLAEAPTTSCFSACRAPTSA